MEEAVSVEGDEPRALMVRDDDAIEPSPSRKRLRGMRVSGKAWKGDKEPVSKMRVGKAFHPSWKEKMAKRAEMDHVRDQERRRREEVEAKRLEERERRQERQKRALINEKRAEIVVPLNPKKLRQKLKSLSKKQKRAIRKTSVAPL